MIGIDDVKAAAGRLRGVAIETPLISNSELDAVCGGRVLIKPECLQRTGSFKIRGAYNLLSQLAPDKARLGVVAWSSGNHAQGVAAAAGLLGIRAAIVMPEDAPALKLHNTRRLGGEVITFDRYTGDREKIARQIAGERDAAIVPSFDHDHIIAGQGTMGLEIAMQCEARGVEPEQVLIPCGGGGLTAGAAVAIKASYPGSHIFTVEPDTYDDTARSLSKGEIVSADPSIFSICDALLTPKPGKKTFAINRQLVDRGLSVTEAEVRAAMRFAFMHLKLVAEPGGAVALAAVLAGVIDTADRTTVVVISGGNVDPDLFGEIQAEPN